MAEQRIEMETLHALIDGELPESERAQAMAAIQADPRAALDHATFSSLKQATSILPSPEYSETTWRQCVGRLDEIDRNRRTETFVSRHAWSMCGAFLLLIAGAGTLNRFHGQHFDSNAMSHIASSLVPTSKATDTSNIGKWLQDKVGAAPLEHLEGLTAVRAEAGVVDDRQVARIVFRDSDGDMTLFVVQGDVDLDELQVLPNSNLRVVPFPDGNCVGWRANGSTMLLSGPRDAESLARVAGVIGQQLHLQVRS